MTSHYPDEYLPVRTMGLLDMNAHARRLLESGGHDDVDAFIRLMLAGRFKDENGVMHRVLLSPSHNQPPIDEFESHVVYTGDFDSLIGFTHNLPFLHSLSVIPIPSFMFTLRKNIHLKLPWTDRRVSKLCLK